MLIVKTKLLVCKVNLTHKYLNILFIKNELLTENKECLLRSVKLKILFVRTELLICDVNTHKT